VRNAEIAARILGVQLRSLEARNSPEIDSAFDAIAREGADALLVLVDAILITQRKQIRSAGLVPLRTLSTKVAARRNISVGFGP
jgi:hypothetical protein